MWLKFVKLRPMTLNCKAALSNYRKDQHSLLLLMPLPKPDQNFSFHTFFLKNTVLKMATLKFPEVFRMNEPFSAWCPLKGHTYWTNLHLKTWTMNHGTVNHAMSHSSPFFQILCFKIKRRYAIITERSVLWFLHIASVIGHTISYTTPYFWYLEVLRGKYS